MSECTDNFFNVSDENIYCSNQTDTKTEVDPFFYVCDELLDTKLIKINKTVFAEPIVIGNPTQEGKSTEKFKTIDNVTIQMRRGKRNKYFFTIGDDSNPVRPQTDCNKSFSSIPLLKCHMRKVHCSVATYEYVCERCGRRFTAMYLLTRHQATHARDKVACAVCHVMLSRRTRDANSVRMDDCYDIVSSMAGAGDWK